MLARDDKPGVWVASSTADVEAALSSSAVRVRPIDSPVPPDLGRGRAAEVFARLVRMNDGAQRLIVKQAIHQALDDVSGEEVRWAGDVVAAWLLDDDPALDGSFLDRWVGAFPVGVIAALLGFDRATFDVAVAHAGTLAACFGPSPPARVLPAANAAADELTLMVLDAANAHPRCIAGLVLAAVGPPRHDDAVANLVGLFFQAHDATAGMLGVSIAGTDDGGVVSTRRYVAERVVLAGQVVEPGDCILIDLAASGRPFGHGLHRCPGRRLAEMIVECGVEMLPPELRELAVPVGYRPLPNVRVPLFGQRSSSGHRPDPGPLGWASS